jgi:hypothetical protein
MESINREGDPSMKPIDVRTMSAMLAGTFLVSALAINRATAADPDSGASRPPAAIVRLAPLVGAWTGEGKVTEGGQTNPIKLRHQWEPIADTWGYQIHETVDMGAMGTYRSENFFGYDIGAEKLHLFTVSNMADCHDHAGGWKDDTHFALRYDGIAEGKPFVEEITGIIGAPNQYTFKAVRTVEGKVASVFEATMHRQSNQTSLER